MLVKKITKMDHTHLYLPDLTVALIIGGKSSRFGSLKQLASIKNRQLIELAFQKGEQLTGNMIAITGSRRFGLPDKVKQYNDIYLGKGPMGGIHTALVHCQTQYCAMIPCDMPFLSSTIYRHLYNEISPDKPVVAASHRGVEPLVSIWPKEVLPAVARAIEQNQLKLYRLLEELSAKFIDLPHTMPLYSEKYFININTIDDLQKVQEILNGSEKIP